MKKSRRVTPEFIFHFRTIMLSGIFIFTFLGLQGCSGKLPQTGQEVKNVQVIQAAFSPLNVYAEYAGRIKPREEVTVSSKISGRVSSVKADVGDEVTKDQILFTLESNDIQAQHRQSQAALETARNNLLRTSDSSYIQQLIQAEAAQKQAQLQYSDAKTYYEKNLKLYRDGAVSKQQLDDIETRLNNASVQLDSANENLKLLKERSGPQQSDIAFTQLEQAQAAVELSSAQLQNSSISSPIQGIVSARGVDPGEVISSSIPAFTIMNIQSLTIEVNLSDTQAGKLVKGRTVPVKIGNAEGKVYQGTVDSISPSADPKTQLTLVKIKLDNPDGSIKPGNLAKVSLPVENKEKVLTVPNAAVIMENGVQYVFTVKSELVKKLQVTTGLVTEKVTEITGNLNEDDSVIIEGQSFINEGEKVNIIK